MLTLLLFGCASNPGLDHAASPTRSAARISGDGLTLADAEMADRWVLRGSLGDTCDGITLEGWTVTSLFEGSGLPAGLARTCLLERSSSGAADPRSLGAVPDLAVVAALTEGTPETLAESYVAQIRPVPAYVAVPTPAARLTIVDTSATHEAGSVEVVEDASSVNPHGRYMATLAQRAVCDDDADASPTCGAEIATQLALGLTWDGSDFVAEPDGGNFGSQAHLARAIHAAVTEWEADYAAGDAGPLVVSLSLGWHPEAGGAGTLDAPAAAVHDALTWAACKDVLVVAAVGNADTPITAADAGGPLYPAAWETEPAPAAAECGSSTWDVTTTATDLVETVYRPLVYGVSGLDGGQRTLANQRPDATTLHAGPAAHLSAWNTGDGDWLDPVSGTSAANVSVAAAAAVVRTHAPDLSAHDVMRVLRDGGTALGDAAVCYDPEGDGCDAVHAVSVCDGLVAACATGWATCDASYTAALCDTHAAPEPLEAGAVGAVIDVIAASRYGRCGSGRFLTDATRVRYRCPWEELYAGTTLPMTLPQPSGGECPWCPATQPDRVDLVTVSNMSTLRNMTISVTKTTALGTVTVTHYPLGVLSGRSRTIYLPDFNPADATLPLDSTVTAMVLSYTYLGGNVSYTEPIPLTWAP